MDKLLESAMKREKIKSILWRMIAELRRGDPTDSERLVAEATEALERVELSIWLTRKKRRRGTPSQSSGCKTRGGKGTAQRSIESAAGGFEARESCTDPSTSRRFSKPAASSFRRDSLQSPTQTAMSDANVVIRAILIDLLARSKAANPRQVDSLLEETTAKLFRAVRYQDRLLTEKEVVLRFPFLSLSMLRNYRNRNMGPKYIKFSASRNSRLYYRIADIESWIVAHYRLKAFVP